MTPPYKQLSLSEKVIIKQELDRGISFRQIALLVGRSSSTISRDGRVKRSLVKGPKSCRALLQAALLPSSHPSVQPVPRARRLFARAVTAETAAAPMRPR